MIDLQTVKDAYKSFEVNNIALVKSKYNVADASTNVRTSSILKALLTTGKLKHPNEQWIIRSEQSFLFSHKK